MKWLKVFFGSFYGIFRLKIYHETLDLKRDYTRPKSGFIFGYTKIVDIEQFIR